MKLTARLCLVPRLRMTGDTSLLSLYAFMACIKPFFKTSTQWTDKVSKSLCYNVCCLHADCIHLPNVAQPNPTMVTMNRIIKSNVDCFISRIILQTISAIVVGSRQYPRTHTLWKNDLK
jgi:hypothetical protein